MLVGPRLDSGCLQAYRCSVKRLGMGWGLIPIGPGLEWGCFHRQQSLPLAVKGLLREIKRYIYHSLTDAQLTRLWSVELNLN